MQGTKGAEQKSPFVPFEAWAVSALNKTDKYLKLNYNDANINAPDKMKDEFLLNALLSRVWMDLLSWKLFLLCCWQICLWP